MDLVSAPPAVEALLLFVEVQSLAGSAPSSDTPAAYATFALDVLSALERLEVLAEPAHPKSTAEARFLSIYFPFVMISSIALMRGRFVKRRAVRSSRILGLQRKFLWDFPFFG